jgi:hypothetical protein
MTYVTLVALLLILPSLAASATYYVAPSGGGGCSTNTNSPQGGLLNGIACLSSGDTLILKNGVYPNKLNDVVPSNVTIRAENARQAILRPGAVDQIITLGPGNTRSNITFDGLYLDGNNQATGQIFSLYSIGPGIVFQNGEIANIVGKHGPDGSWGVGGGPANANDGYTVRNTYFHDIGWLSDPPGDCSSCYSYGMYISSNNVVVEDCVFERISGYSFQIYASGGAITGVIIRRNTFKDTDALIIGGAGGGGGTGTRVENNVLIHLGWTADGFDNQGMNVQRNGSIIVNNTIVGSRRECIVLNDTNNIVRNNICYGNGTDAIQDYGSGNVKDHNLLGADPQFVNAGTDDYHLQGSSLARDMGTNTNCPSDDRDGLARPINGTCDIGAYEYGTPPPSGPVTVYVSAGGHGDTPSDSNTCTQAQTITTPKATVAAGMACASAAGSTVRIRGGLYTQPTIRTSTLPMPLAGGTDWNTPTTIGAYNGEAVTIRASSASFAVLYFDRGAADHYILLDSLTLDAANLSDGALLLDNGAHHIRFQNGELRNAAFSVVYLENVNNIEILNSLIENSTTFPLIQIVGTSADALIQGNVIRNATASQALVVAGTAPRAILRKNQISNVGGSSVPALDVAGDDFLMVNNFVWGSYAGLKLGSGAANAKIYNNTLVGNTTYGMQLDATSTGVQVINNIVASNGTAQITNNTGATLTTNLTTTPGFANAGAGDFHLTQSSVNAIDMGTTLASDVPDDIWGHTRTGVWDIGADEFQGTPAVPPAFSSANPAIGMFLAY